jgi:hypothetical protein
MPDPTKVPAFTKGPLDYLFALAISLAAVFLSFPVEPQETRWVVFGVGVFMTLTVVLAALKPTKP